MDGLHVHQIPEGDYLISGGNFAQDGAFTPLYLNLKGGNASEGALVSLWDDSANPDNHWRIRHWDNSTTRFTMQNLTSQLYLSVPQGSVALGVRPSMHTLPAGYNPDLSWQVFQHEDHVVESTYVFMNTQSQTFLNVAGGRIQYGNKVHMWDNPDSADSQWSFDIPPISIVDEAQAVFNLMDAPLRHD